MSTKSCPTSDSVISSCKFVRGSFYRFLCFSPTISQQRKTGKLIFTSPFSFISFLLHNSTRGSLFIQWFVSSISKDIADFYLHFRDGRNKILFEKTLAYDTRIGNITSVELEGIDFEKNVDVCMLAKNSDGVILHFDESQCTRMPSNFNAVMRKYNKRPSTFFKVFEMDKNHLGRNAIALTSGSTRMLTSTLSMVTLLCITRIIM